MEINELEQLRIYSELDLIYKIIEIAESNKRRVEQFIKGNNKAGVDVRHSMQDIRLLAELVRESIQTKKRTKQSDIDEPISLTKLERMIINKKNSLEKEEIYIKRVENFRKQERKERIK